MPQSNRVKVSPPVAAGKYKAGDVVGGLQTIPRPFGVPLTGILKSLTVKDAANQKSGLTVLLFCCRPAGTYAGQKPFAWAAGDFARCIGKVSVAATDYETVAGLALATTAAGDLMACNDEKDNASYAVAVLKDAANFANPDVLEFQYGFLQD